MNPDQVLRRGSKGRLVRELQGLINTYHGALKLELDEEFGSLTEGLVKDFQKAVKLKDDGVVGPKTWSALRNHGVPVVPTPTFPDPFDLAELERFFRGLDMRFPTANGSAVAMSNGSASAAMKNAVKVPAAVKPPGMVRTAPAAQTKMQAAAKPAEKKLPKAVLPTDFGNFRRISFPGYAGQGYVIRDFLKLDKHAIQLAPTRRIFDDVPLPAGLKNECAQLVQYFGIPRTNQWRRGPRVCDFKVGELPVGTVVATLRDGKYYSDYSGRSHVGIYLGHADHQKAIDEDDQKVGVELFDQFNGHKIMRRTYKYSAEADKQGKVARKSWTDASGTVQKHRVSWMKDGEEYYVLLTGTGE